MSTKKPDKKPDREFTKKPLDGADSDDTVAASPQKIQDDVPAKKKKPRSKKREKKHTATTVSEDAPTEVRTVGAPDDDTDTDLVSTSVLASSDRSKSVAHSEADMVLDDKRKQDIDEDLREIYSEKDGSLPDMTTFQTKRSGGILRALGVLLVSLTFLAGVAWFGFFTFQPQARFSEQDVIVSVTGPETVVIGDTVRYRIKYTNDQSVPLTQATLQVRYPAGFVFVSSTLLPTNDDHDTWQLGSIDPRAGDTLEIIGRLYGDVDTEQSLRVFFNYTPANFSSEFQKVQSARTMFSESPIDVVIDGPELVGVGAPATWTITVSGQQPEENVAIVLEFPDGFTLSSADPLADEQSPRQWTIPAGTATSTITLIGMFDTPGEPVLTARAYVALDPTLGTELDRVEVASVDERVVVSETDVITNLLINGVMKDFGILAGETLNSTLVVQNAGELPMQDVVVRFVLDSPSDGAKTMFDWVPILEDMDPAIRGEQLDSETRRATVTWTSAQIPELALLNPGEEVQINFRIPILSPTDFDLTAFETAVAIVSSDIQYTQHDARETANTTPMNITINSDLRFSTQHTIAVDETSETEQHTIVYILENSFHGLEDIRLSANIYGDVSVEDFVLPAGDATYEEETGILTWTIAQMPLGLDILPFEFVVTLSERNPSQSNLTSKVRIQAKDVVTGETITIVGSEILLGGDDIPDDIEA